MQTAATESRLSRACASWNRFWFTPSDPTVLAAIRIITGLVTLYTLIGYSLDLQEFVGKYGWLDLELRQEQYYDAPVPDVPFDWLANNSREPSTVEERTYWLDYVRKWR